MTALYWGIWRARNNLLWNGQAIDPIRVINSSLEVLSQWRSAQAPESTCLLSGLTQADGAASWLPPLSGELKLNLDGALFEEQNRYGVGLVVRDEKGLLVEARTKLFVGTVQPEIAEAVGFKEALSWIKGSHWNKVTLESDCLVAIQSIRNKTNMISLFGDIINDCRSLLLELPLVKCIFVKRSANVVAHSFARASLSYPDRSFSLGDVPTDLLPHLVAEFEV